MWRNTYKDCPPDTPFLSEQVESGKGIVGCEMHDLNGWGESHHVYKGKGKNTLATLWSFFFGTKVNRK